MRPSEVPAIFASAAPSCWPMALATSPSKFAAQPGVEVSPLCQAVKAWRKLWVMFPLAKTSTPSSRSGASCFPSSRCAAGGSLASMLSCTTGRSAPGRR